MVSPARWGLGWWGSDLLVCVRSHRGPWGPSDSLESTELSHAADNIGKHLKYLLNIYMLEAVLYTLFHLLPRSTNSGRKKLPVFEDNVHLKSKAGRDLPWEQSRVFSQETWCMWEGKTWWLTMEELLQREWQKLVFGRTSSIRASFSLMWVSDKDPKEVLCKDNYNFPKWKGKSLMLPPCVDRRIFFSWKDTVITQAKAWKPPGALLDHVTYVHGKCR